MRREIGRIGLAYMVSRVVKGGTRRRGKALFLPIIRLPGVVGEKEEHLLERGSREVSAEEEESQFLAVECLALRELDTVPKIERESKVRIYSRDRSKAESSW